MSELTTPELPAWVYKRDGRLAPFEPDKICQALFAATEALGQPSAFLARELTDGILHFVATEYAGTLPTTAQIAELAAKVVRELGHPDLALVFGDGQRRPKKIGSLWRPSGTPPETVVSFSPQLAPEMVVRQCLAAYSRQAIFSRDLVAAQQDGLLVLGDLETPLHLHCSLVAGCPDPEKLLQDLLPVRRLARGLVFDGPEYALSSAAAAREWAQGLLAGLEAFDLWAVVNLNCRQPPPWAADSGTGPLFPEAIGLSADDDQPDILETLLDTLVAAAGGRLWIDWHLAEEAASALPGRPWQAAPQVRYVFDRPRRPLALADGLDRRHQAVLQTVGVHLPRVVEFLAAGGQPQRLLVKLPSLARMLISVGVQKRRFLRERGSTELQRGFLLDRARLVVVPLGLEEAVTALAGQGISLQPEGEVAEDLAQGRLLALLPGFRVPPMEIHAITPQREIPEKVRRVITALRSHFAEPGGAARPL